MKLMNLMVAMILAVLAISCGHTNNLGKYELKDREFYYETQIDPQARDVRIVYTNESTSEKKSDKEKTTDLVVDVVKAIGSIFLSADTESKMRRAVDPQAIINNISDGIHNSMVKYSMVKRVGELGSNTKYIVTTILDECQINSTPYGMHLRVRAISRIIDRETGEEIWDCAEAENVPLRNRWYVPKGSTATRTISDIIQTADILSLSEAEIKEAVNQAASEVGHLFGQEYLDDLNEWRRK